ncbi:MAG: tripartite tricarboxylate transporter substrate binding protein [Candidatus Rariloculaceae bacterium]
MSILTIKRLMIKVLQASMLGLVFKIVMVSLIIAPVYKAGAQETYPQDVVTLITHSSPGGGSDVFLRQLARYLGPELGVDIAIENVRGGSGVRAVAELVNSPADGSTFYAYTPTIIYTSLLSNPDYTFRDLQPLVNVFFDEDVIYTSASGPFETLSDVIDTARERRGRWGASTPASLERQALEQLKRAAGIAPAIVTHEGGGDLMLNVLNGTLDIGVGEAQEIRSQLEADRLRVLAVFSAERMQELPNVPTVSELGYDLVLTKFRGLAGPKDTPIEIILALENAIQRLLNDPDYRDIYEDEMLTARYMSHEDFSDFIALFSANTESFLRDTGVIQ